MLRNFDKQDNVIKSRISSLQCMKTCSVMFWTGLKKASISTSPLKDEKYFQSQEKNEVFFGVEVKTETLLRILHRIDWLYFEKHLFG